APHGTDDIPDDVQSELERSSSEQGFARVLVVDTHNSMGRAMDDPDKADMIEAGKRLLARLKSEKQRIFSVGYSNSPSNPEFSQEVGQAGVGILALGIAGSKFGIGWVDANNMAIGLREKILSATNTPDFSMAEVCSSDTHATAGKRTREGYYPLG